MVKGDLVNDIVALPVQDRVCVVCLLLSWMGQVVKDSLPLGIRFVAPLEYYQKAHLCVRAYMNRPTDPLYIPVLNPSFQGGSSCQLLRLFSR